jgi:type II secretory ATPase GspE/PulE/Tfp pilus assembly ATPase PilB-like protein
MAGVYRIQTGQKSAEIRPEVTAADAIAGINRKFGEEKIAKQAKNLGLPYVDILLAPISADLLRQIDLAECEIANALPFFAMGKKIRVAVTDPESDETKKYLENLKNKHLEVQINLAGSASLAAKLTELKSLRPREVVVFDNKNAEVDLKSHAEEVKELAELANDSFELSAAENLNRLLIGALRAGASDIHLQPEEADLLVRFRIDGMLQDILHLSHKIGFQILDQLKYQAKLKLNVSKIPQDGRTSFTASGRSVDLRVSTLPSEYGENIVCRILDKQHGIIPFEQLGFTDQNLKLIYHALNQRSGLILVTGPTGSGKTTTLYTMLDKLNKPENKVATLEDPVEYHLPGLTQSQIDEEHGYTFAAGLRALLRQDPDIIMVGEIRDRETAEIAAQAAMTGHTVLATLHTNSAVESIARLINIGLPPFVVASSVGLITAQRLVRRLHADCAQKKPITAAEREIINSALAEIHKIDPSASTEAPEFLLHPVGCEACSHTGYRGQLAVAEGFTLTDELKDLTLASSSTSKLAAEIRAKQKMKSFVEDGILKVCAGQTTLAEVSRIGDLHKIQLNA